VTTTALILSILALVLSLGSLSWQAWSWFRSGPVLRVKVTNIVADSGRISAYGIPEPDHYVQVEVVNHGRAAATISTWGIELPGGESMFVTLPPPISDRLPGRLEPHASLRLHVEGEELRKLSRERGVPFKAMRPWVASATGRKIYARSGVPLE
jgi:hypothetical protein